MNPLGPKARVWLAVPLFSIALACFVYAKPKSPKLTAKQIAEIRDGCSRLANTYMMNCIGNIPPNSTNTQGDRQTCIDQANQEERDCLKREGVSIPKNGPLGPVQQISPPPKSNPQKPRKGPGNVSGLPESHPTATPKKGPGKTGTNGVGHSSPTPSPNGPTLLKKSGNASPTPKEDHHK